MVGFMDHHSYQPMLFLQQRLLLPAPVKREVWVYTGVVIAHNWKASRHSSACTALPGISQSQSVLASRSCKRLVSACLLNRVTSVSDSVNWVHTARWVQDDRFVTSSGVTAGADMAVYVMKQQFGSAVAAEAAKYNEYIPHTNPDEDPFADDSYLPEV